MPSQYSHHGTFSAEFEEYLNAHRNDPFLKASEADDDALSIVDVRAGLSSAEQECWKRSDYAISRADHFVRASGTSPHDITISIWRAKDQDLASARSVALVVHGGGWTLGSRFADSFLVRGLLEAQASAVVTVDYRLSPEHPYPAGLDDVKDVFRWMLSSPGALFKLPIQASYTIDLAGFSAGGQMAASLSLWARDNGFAQTIRRCILISPATCHYRSHAQARQRFGCVLESLQEVDTPLLTTVQLKAFWDNLCSGPDGTDEYGVSPILAGSLKGLPPTYIQVSGADPLRDEAMAYSDALKAAGVEVQMDVFSGMPHAYQSDLLGMASRGAAIEKLVAWMSDKTSRA